jgi:hypothetical protein
MAIPHPINPITAMTWAVVAMPLPVKVGSASMFLFASAALLSAQGPMMIAHTKIPMIAMIKAWVASGQVFVACPGIGGAGRPWTAITLHDPQNFCP